MGREWGFFDQGMMFFGHDMKFHNHEIGLKFKKWKLHVQKIGNHDLGIEYRDLE